MGCARAIASCCHPNSGVLRCGFAALWRAFLPPFFLSLSTLLFILRRTRTSFVCEDVGGQHRHKHHTNILKKVMHMSPIFFFSGSPPSFVTTKAPVGAGRFSGGLQMNQRENAVCPFWVAVARESPKEKTRKPKRAGRLGALERQTRTASASFSAPPFAQMVSRLSSLDCLFDNKKKVFCSFRDKFLHCYFFIQGTWRAGKERVKGDGVAVTARHARRSNGAATVGGRRRVCRSARQTARIRPIATGRRGQRRCLTTCRQRDMRALAQTEAACIVMQSVGRSSFFSTAIPLFFPLCCCCVSFLFPFSKALFFPVVVVVWRVSARNGDGRR